jgi:hypothetical protein
MSGVFHRRFHSIAYNDSNKSAALFIGQYPASVQ